MCGIFLSCGRPPATHPSVTLLEYLTKRGPDSLQTSSITLQSEECPCTLNAVSSVLAIRGTAITEQPIKEHDPQSSFLLWNGEAWKYDAELVQTNDAEFIGRHLFAAVRSADASTHSRCNASNPVFHTVVAVLSRVSGPYAFVFYDSSNRLLFYGRDCLGRRSLLTRRPSHGLLELSSVSDGSKDMDFHEVEADGIYVVDLAPGARVKSANDKNQVGLLPALHISWPYDESLNLVGNQESPFPTLNKEPPFNAILDLDSPAVEDLFRHLRTSITIRLSSIPVTDLMGIPRQQIAILFSGGLDCTLIARIAHDVLPSQIEIDLLNVAFENPRVVEAANKSDSATSNSYSVYERCPDRLTGRSSYEELRKVCPSRKWRFVAINIPYSETFSHRSTVLTLLLPHNTEMDLSIGYALYFASRGCGLIATEHGSDVFFTTPAKVLLSGLGADELFGGYQRHATAYDRRGHSGLADELELDFKRIGKRNLGRDDRIISHWGKEVRYPYLDEDVVTWALKAPISHKCGFGQDRGAKPSLDPSKKILRLLAWQLGVRVAAGEKKRAIQFGARTARMETGKKKGTQLVSEEH